MLLQLELPEDWWSDLLDYVKLVINLMVLDSTGVSPARLVYGQDTVACGCVFWVFG